MIFFRGKITSNLFFRLCNSDKNFLRSVDLNDENSNKAQKSSFHTYSSITSISISDYLNKLLICDSEGSIIMSTNPESWKNSQSFRVYSIFLLWVQMHLSITFYNFSNWSSLFQLQTRMKDTKIFLILIRCLLSSRGSKRTYA